MVVNGAIRECWQAIASASLVCLPLNAGGGFVKCAPLFIRSPGLRRA